MTKITIQTLIDHQAEATVDDKKTIRQVRTDVTKKIRMSFWYF